MIGVLLRPKYLSFKNRWRKQSLAKRRSQDIVLFTFSIAVMFGMYHGTLWVLKQMNSLPFLIYMPPALPLGLMLMMLLVMVCVSSLATTLGNLFLSDDIDLLLSSPISMFKFFAARFSYVLLTVSWMPFVFIFPVLAAFSSTYHMSVYFPLYTLIVLVPYFVIPAACSVILSSGVMSVIDPRWTRIITLLCLGLAMAGIVYLINLLGDLITHPNDPNQILRLVSTIAASNASWLPSSWAAVALSESLVPSGKDAEVRLILLYCCAVACTGMAYLSIELLHARGYTRAKNTKRTGRRNAKRTSLESRIAHPTIAVIFKEFKSIFRDLAQSTQVLFLACMCLLYLANLRMFVSIDSFPIESRFMWQNIFFMMHTSITAFFTSSICTRIVFSSVSLEGKQFWLLQVAPVDLHQVLRSKFWAWFIPVSVISATLFASGTYVIVGRLDLLVFFVALSFFVSYGIVGLGIGLGAYFADFSWEHPSQLALSLGSFVYMLSSAVLVIANVIPMSILLRLRPPTNEMLLAYNIAMSVFLAAIVIAVNVGLARAAMRLGSKALKQGAYA